MPGKITKKRSRASPRNTGVDDDEQTGDDQDIDQDSPLRARRDGRTSQSSPQGGVQSGLYPSRELERIQDDFDMDMSYVSARSQVRHSGTDSVSETDHSDSFNWSATSGFESPHNRSRASHRQQNTRQTQLYGSKMDRSPQNMGGLRRAPLHSDVMDTSFSGPRPRPLGHGEGRSIGDRHRQHSGAARPRPSAGNPPHDGPALSSIITILLAIVFVVLVAIYAVKQNSPDAEIMSKDSDLTEREQMLNKFTNFFNQLRPAFPSQSRRMWATIGAGSKSVFRTETPPQPGVILLAGSQTAVKTMDCLTTKVSDILMRTYGCGHPTVFNTGDHLKLNATHLKLKIDETFQSGLSPGNTNVAILNNLEKVPGQAAMMFHAYCDNESAPFKDAIIIFTMVLSLSEQEVLDMEDRDLQIHVESRLQEIWERDIGYDNTMALKSRVANGIGIVKAERILPC